MTELDILIKNGIVYDGSIAEPYVTDIGIKEDKIVAIGELEAQAGKIINAQGLAVTPGFIDVHNHSDLSFSLLNPDWQNLPSKSLDILSGNYNYLYQGVTTVITGNCGYGFTDINEWFDLVKGVDFATNVYHLLPHGYLRRELFGESQPTELSKEQLKLLKQRVIEEMEKGAIGLSSGLAYAPGYYALIDELIELAKIVAEYNGVYSTHIRDESGNILTNGNSAVLESIGEAIQISRQANIPLQISHLKIMAPYNDVKASQILSLIESGRKEGLDITADQYPYISGSSHLSFLLPNKYQAYCGVKKELQTIAGKNLIEKEIASVFANVISPDKIIICDYPNNEMYSGETLQKIADLENTDPVSLYVKLACVDRAPFAIFFLVNEQAMKEFMPHPYIFTASDGMSLIKSNGRHHPRAYGTFTRKLKKFVLEDKVLDMFSVLRSMTSLPAEKFHIKNRGKIAIGNYADIAVIDFTKLNDYATYQNPHQYSEGIVNLLVNGVLTIENGKITGIRGGRPLRHYQ